jgi:uncharacterized protein YdgA (DUF945 family)
LVSIFALGQNPRNIVFAGNETAPQLQYKRIEIATIGMKSRRDDIVVAYFVKI